MPFDHLLDDATSPADAAEAAQIMAKATVDDEGATEAERADSRTILALSWEELVESFSAAARTGRHEASPWPAVLHPAHLRFKQTGISSGLHIIGVQMGDEFDASLTDDDRAVLEQTGISPPLLDRLRALREANESES